jgi:hypothetical protein
MADDARAEEAPRLQTAAIGDDALMIVVTGEKRNKGGMAAWGTDAARGCLKGRKGMPQGQTRR